MSTATPLSIPLHFASSSSHPIRGPVVPPDWQRKWHRSDYPRRREIKAKVEADDVYDEEWDEGELKRWATCMATWEDKPAADAEQATTSRPSTPTHASPSLRISIADEDGEAVQISQDLPRAGRAAYTRPVGGRRGGRRVALGLQNGTIWLFAGRVTKPTRPASPPEPTSRVRSPSRSSISSGIVASPSLGSSGLSSRAGEMDVSTHMSPIAGTSDVNAAGSATRNSSGVDAEERLETQWHAGRESNTVVGGMMEALGLNHASQHPGHTHNHASTPHSPSRASTPSSSHQQRTPLDSVKHSRTPMVSPPSPVAQVAANGRARTVSAATTTTTTTVGDDSDANSVSEHERGGKMRLSGLMSPGGAARHLRAGNTSTGKGSYEEGKASTREDVSAGLEELAMLQCPSSSPLVSLALPSPDCLASLQEDGQLTVWSLLDATVVHVINLRTTRSLLPEAGAPTATTTPATISSNPLAALAALRSGSNTPAPRSRSNSNAAQPIKAAVSDSNGVLGTCRFHSMQVVKVENARDKLLLLCFDDVKRRVVVADAVEAKVLTTHAMSDCSDIPPVARLVEEGASIELYYVTSLGTIALHAVPLVPPKQIVASVEQNRLGHLSSASAFLRREGVSNATSRAPSIAEEKDAARQDLGRGGLLEDIEGLHLMGEGLLLTWTQSRLQLMRKVAESLVVLDSVQISSLRSVVVEGGIIAVEGEADTSVYHLHDGSLLQQTTRFPMQGQCQVQIVASLPASVFWCCLSEEGQIQLHCNQAIVWQGTGVQDDSSTITASLPFSMERVMLSLSSGHVVMASLAELVSGRLPTPSADTPRHKGHINLLRLVVNPRTQSKHVVGGTEEGDIIFWEAATLRKQSERSLLACPVADMVVLGNDDNSLRLNGCLACVGADGSLVMLLLDGLQHLYTIPGRGVPLEMLAVRADELLLLYEDARARVWDMRTLELRRSIGHEQAVSLLEDGKGWWSQFSMGPWQMKAEKGSAGVLSSVPTGRDVGAGTMTANLRRAVEAASRMVTPFISAAPVVEREEVYEEGDGPASSVRVEVPMKSANGKKALHTLRPLMQSLIPFGLGAEGDECCKKILGVDQVQTTDWILSGTFSLPGHLTLAMHAKEPTSLLSLSPVVTTARLVALTAMLFVVGHISELESTSVELLTLLGALPALVGDTFQPPCLALLTGYITDSVVEIQQAAQTLFSTTLDAMSQAEVDSLCEVWIERLPSRGGEGEQAGKAILLLGLIATERYLMLPPALLKEVASSISIFMREDAAPLQQSTAILLCDRGFTIFQHYFDAMEIVRSLFSLSTSKQDSRQDVTAENRNLARRATLRIAEDNTPLFMTTLSLDILHAQSPAHCNATMRLVALMVRKKPLILYPNLPRLAEAVVKSLDPTDTSMRSVIHRSATIIISELIATYPTISFHKDLQRLAVGTFEGAIIMYDLKTSTRLYVIEAHQNSLSGLSFSHDGRRLISVCLKDHMVKVWKTGVGFSAFLNFGGAPRQGGLLSSSGPASSGVPPSSAASRPHASARGTSAYKTYEFGIFPVEEEISSPSGKNGEAGNLRLLSFQWGGERNVRVQVGETSMAFDVA